MKIAVINLGCKVNQYEADAIASGLKDRGYEVTENIEFADCYIINTCAVTAEAERKSRQAVARVRKFNQKAPVYICGCASQNNRIQFEKDGVVFIGGTSGKGGICDLVDKNNLESGLIQKDINTEDSTYKELEITSFYEDFGFSKSLRTRAFIKIQDGCNNFCSYCLIPYVRGRSRSRDIDSIINECRIMSQNSKEIVLTGIDISSYGKDKGMSLKDLITALKDIKCNIRIGSLEAGVIDSGFLTSLKELYHFCPHFHLSLQSGDNTVLKSMNRHYSAEEYAVKVELIRKFFPDCAITTDIIVGFPAETDEGFWNTCNFAKSIKFADIHVFPYSKRAGTRAYKMKTLNSDIIDERLKQLTAIKHELKSCYESKFIGKTVSVLTEETDNGYTIGYTDNYIRVYLEGIHDLNKFIKVIPSEIYSDGLKAKKELI